MFKIAGAGAVLVLAYWLGNDTSNVGNDEQGQQPLIPIGEAQLIVDGAATKEEQLRNLNFFNLKEGIYKTLYKNQERIMEARYEGLQTLAELQISIQCHRLKLSGEGCPILDKFQFHR